MARITQPWPDEIEGLGKRLGELQGRLHSILKVCLREGIEESHYGFIKLSLPQLETITEEIKDVCREVLLYTPDGPGRPPNWVWVTQNILD